MFVRHWTEQHFSRHFGQDIDGLNLRQVSLKTRLRSAPILAVAPSGPVRKVAGRGWNQDTWTVDLYKMDNLPLYEMSPIAQ